MCSPPCPITSGILSTNARPQSITLPSQGRAGRDHMIELDTIERRAAIITEAGARPIGELNGLVWFTDPITKTTLVCAPEDVTVEYIQMKLKKSRDSFGVQQPQAHHAA
jgi:hypothetical protein